MAPVTIEETEQTVQQEYVVVEEAGAHIEEDGTDWCAWWADYAETWE